MERIKIWIKVIYWYLFSWKCPNKAKLLTADETVEKIIASGKSLIRLGDGELNCLEGKDVHYQRFDPQLQTEMKTLIDSYVLNYGNCDYLLCMPNEFLRCSGMKLAERRVWVASWSRFRYVFKKEYDKAIPYGDAFLFAKNYEKTYSQIWKDKTDVIFVHNNAKYAESFQKKYQKRVHFVKVINRDCYSEIDNLVDEIQRKIHLIVERKNAIVLISAGPCAKAMVFRLQNCGVQVIDTGHCWDEPLSLMQRGNEND